MDTNKSYLYLETISQYVNPAENLDIARIILHLADIPGIEHFVQNNYIWMLADDYDVPEDSHPHLRRNADHPHG